MNKPHCHYRRKQLAKSKPKATTAPRLRDSIGTKRPVGPPQLTLGGDLVATPRGQSVSGLSGVLPLKRCRLSASPATGLVGMQENAFLSDYFACLGFLPLASASMVRQAMVSIMLGSMPQQRQEIFRVGKSGLPGGWQEGFSHQGQDEDWGQVLACRDRTDYTSKCIFWCAIALGALVQGCSSEFVAGYLKLARDSLAECFDGTTVETARAYLVMAFLHRFLGDQESSQKHLAFANSIVERLPQEVIPSGMKSMLHAQGDESRFIYYGCSGSGLGARVEEKPEYSNQIPKAKSFVHERDLCNFYFFAGQYMQNAFLEDIRSEVDLANATAKAGAAHDRGMEGEPGECQEQGTCGRKKGTRDWEGGGLGVPLRSSGSVNESVKSRDRRDPPPAGAAMKTFVKDVLPEMASLLAVIERLRPWIHRCMQAAQLIDGKQAVHKSGTCSGVGSFIFHGCVGYMKAVKGEMRSSFESMTECAKVLMRFPGICRYRPHLAHSVLTAAASSMCRNVYDPVREIYNTILPWNGIPAPPMEEWGVKNPICKHLFCRSLLAETNTMDFASNNLGFSHARVIAASVPTPHSSGLHTSSVTGEKHRSLDCRG